MKCICCYIMIYIHDDRIISVMAHYVCTDHIMGTVTFEVTFEDIHSC